MKSAIHDEVPVLFIQLHERLTILRNHLNHYSLVLMKNNDSEPFHFNLETVSLINFYDTGFEVILKDSSTIYFKYDNIGEFSLIKLDGMLK
ncbi:hypothetical protein [uncultured Methanobrevibacter sp.]|uniref:hypothetical protein n=1 Tax=uncultured Methanobrevibacter sp. TaxID=253161 RepID=UPI0025EBD648|nr:hypothetical protein [uncultured Methanobrevibacter sp.]